MLNQKIKEKSDEIDKISNEITKQNSYKTKDLDSINETYNTYNNSLNRQIKFMKNEQRYEKKNNKNNLKTYFINDNNNFVKITEKLTNDLSKKITNSLNNQCKEKNPEKFVLQFFYQKPKYYKKSYQRKIYGTNNVSCGQKNENKNKVYSPNKNRNNIKNKYNNTDKQNRSYNNINNQLINYKSMVSRCHNATAKKNKTKSKDNDSKIKNLIKKLYNEGLQNQRKKEFIYKENLLKKEEEYKKYTFKPENKYKAKKKEKSNKKNPTNLKKLNNDLYSKQIEWKNKKDKENSRKKKSEEEIYMSLCTFKPDIIKEYIADDEKMIRRNLIDMNYYIINRRNQIKYKRQEGFKLRDYKENKNNKSDINKIKEPLTERIYYRNNGGKNNSMIITTNKHFNYSKIDFVKAVKNLHNEITNLNL